jgi:hypothetical protein
MPMDFQANLSLPPCPAGWYCVAAQPGRQMGMTLRSDSRSPEKQLVVAIKRYIYYFMALVLSRQLHFAVNSDLIIMQLLFHPA